MSEVHVAYAYSRVSTNKQENGPQVQREKLESYYSRNLAHKGFLWGDVYEDVVSGSKAFNLRPAGSVLCQRARPGDIILVTKFDRAFRSSRDFHNQIHYWRQKGCKLVVTDCEVNCTTPNGYCHASVLVAMAQLERELVSERTKEVKQYLKAHGRNYGTNATRGIINGSDGYLKPDPRYDEPTIAFIIECREVQKMTWNKLAIAISNRWLRMAGKQEIRSIAHDNCIARTEAQDIYKFAKAQQELLAAQT